MTLLDIEAKAAGEVKICTTVFNLSLQLWTHAPAASILSIILLLALMISGPFPAPSIHLPALGLPLCGRLPVSLHVFSLLGDLLAVEVDAAVRDHGAGVSGGELGVHVCLHLQERVCGRREAGRQLILQFASSLSVALLPAMPLPVFTCCLQIQ